MKEIKGKDITLGATELYLMRRILQAAIPLAGLTPDELKALNNIRRSVGLDGIDVDDSFIERYGNCFRGCEG